MILAVSIVLTAGVLTFVFLVRPGDIPAEAPPPPAAHLEERKAVVYENLRDLNFEYRLGKLSEGDYVKTKTALQNELAQVLAEIDRIEGGGPRAGQAAPPAGIPEIAAQEPAAAIVCPHCGARFDKPMKFCGECGRPMSGVKE